MTGEIVCSGGDTTLFGTVTGATVCNGGIKMGTNGGNDIGGRGAIAGVCSAGGGG